MSNLNAAQRRVLAWFLRKHLDTVRELSTVKAILKYSAEKRVCPLDWERMLEEIKKTPEYSTDGKEIEPVLAQLENEAEALDWNELLSKMPVGNRPN